MINKPDADHFSIRGSGPDIPCYLNIDGLLEACFVNNDFVEGAHNVGERTPFLISGF